jgi:hypothetical protein
MRYFAKLFHRRQPVLRNAARIVFCGAFFRM